VLRRHAVELVDFRNLVGAKDSSLVGTYSPIDANKRKSTTTDAEQGQSRVDSSKTCGQHDEATGTSPRRGGEDKRVPVGAFPSFQDQELYALFAHLLAWCPRRDTATYRVVQVCGSWVPCVSGCSGVAMTWRIGKNVGMRVFAIPVGFL